MTSRRLTRRTAERPRTGIVHLGLGAFFRAFGALYVEEAMKGHGGDWGIVGVSLQSPATRDALEPQGWAYTALELGRDGEVARQIDVLNGVLVARENPEAVLAAMADPSVKIVSLTVTEKGYCHFPATGALNASHPDILHDLADALPVSAPGFIVRALERRHKMGLPPFTVLCCDNLPRNGSVVRGVVLDLARLIDPALADWIASEGRFPQTMVDRIVPATKPEDVVRVEALIGAHDAAPVVHEPFRQWVVEDSFVGGLRPALDTVGVKLVNDVSIYEHMKLRMLNGSHSTLAYLGYLGGHETIADTVADPDYAAFVKRLWRREIIPALTAPPGESLEVYADALFDRFSNPAIRHRTWQIAMDGSQKLPQRILGTLAENLVAARPHAGLILAIAAWMRYVGGVDEKGQSIDVRDPLAAQLKALSDSSDNAAGKVAALLSVRAVFSEGLATQIAADVTSAYGLLETAGARGAIAACIEEV